MGSTIAVIATVGVLALWRWRLRLHPHWATSEDARFYISAGTWTVLIALYWYLQAQLEPDWVWQVWPILAVASALMLIRGLNALDVAPDQFVAIPPPLRQEDSPRHSADRLLPYRALRR